MQNLYHFHNTFIPLLYSFSFSVIYLIVKFNLFDLNFMKLFSKYYVNYFYLKIQIWSEVCLCNFYFSSLN